MRVLALILIACLTAVETALADEAVAWAALRQGGHVALMRHADAPGYADPPGFRLDDCATQRNLSDKGRADARAVGERLREERIVFGSILTSPWCRCTETARLLGLGTLEIAPTFGNVVILRDQVEVLTQGGRAVIGSWQGPANLLVVTHGANIQALTRGYHPASGEIVVVAGGAGGAVREIGRIRVPGS